VEELVSDEPRYPEVHVDVPVDQVDDASVLLFELGASGVEQRDEGTLAKGPGSGLATLVASFADRALAEAAARQIDPAWSPRVAELVGDAWRDEWKKHFAPFRLTDRITIRPPWEAYEPREPREIVLELEPGRAFGTGLHATTALVARALEAFGPRMSNAEVLDVGTGSGILALVAVALGAARARAIDVDPDAVLVTADNARRNEFERRIDASVTPVVEIPGDFDVVVANIEARVLVDLSAALAARVRPGGVLVLSGILSDQEEDVTRAFGSLRMRAAPHENEWVALVLEKDFLLL
jgi:ribosomal protein L11 methyltransferase